MRSFQDRNPIAIGLASVAVIGMLVGLAFMVGILHLFERAYPVRGVFSDASGIRKGDDVRVAGVKSGRVTDVKADRQTGTVIVEFVVNDNVHLGREARAEIALQTLLGTKYLRLSGPATGPLLEDLPKDQRVIPLERTKTPFDVFELTKVGTESIQQTDTEKLNQLITSLADITEGKHEDIRKLVSGIADVSAAVTARDAQLRELLDRAERLSALLADKDETLVALIDQSDAVLQLIARRRAEVARALQQGGEATSELARVISANKAQLDAILDTLHPTIDILDRRAADIDRALSWLGPGAYGLSLAVDHGPWQDIYVRAVGPDLIGELIAASGGAGP